ncbi:MAG: hypothetical protein IKS71_04055 [Bacteroidales bacterium]|nr:hypothetical protein [Bacteroidales bacterium]
MKNIAKYLFAISVAALAFAACEKETEEVKPGEPDVEGCYGVFFPTQEASGSHIFNPTQEKVIEVKVGRTNTKGDIVVPVKAEFSAEGVFTMTNVAFADGQAETTFTLNFEAAEEGVNYSAHFLIEDNQYASLYSSSAIGLDLSVLCVDMKYWTNEAGEKIKVHFTQGWWGEEADAYIRYYEVNGVRTCFTETIPESHFYKDYYTGYGFWGVADNADDAAEWTFIWYTKTKNADGNNFIRIPLVNTGYYNDSYSADVYALDYFYWNATNPDDEAEFLSYASKNSDVVSYYDGNGGFYFSIRSYYMFGVGGWNPGAYDTIGIAEGFTRVDYSLELDTDFSADGVTPVYIEAGADVSQIKYLVAEGALSAIQVENKIADILNYKEFTEFFDEFEVDGATKYATLELAPEKTGKYTFIALAYDEKFAYQNAASIVINHVAASDLETLAVDVDVFTEDTPARYKELHDSDSFAYGIAGSNLTEVHKAIFSEGTITKNGMDVVVNAVKNGASYAVSEDVLAEINSDGGYYDVVSGLSQDTNYYVIVWATNGSLEQVVYDTYKTAIIPEVWESIGTGSYTDDVITGYFNVQPKTYNVEIERSADDPTRFRMIYPYDSKYPYNEEGDWDTSKSYDIIFTVVDDQHVYIAPQPLGIDWGYGMFYMTTIAGYYMAAGKTVEEVVAAGIPFGVLENGVITFPDPTEEGGATLQVALADYNNGQFVAANGNGAAKIVLPSSFTYSAAPAKASKPADLTVKASGKTLPALRYERDPKAIKVKTSVSYERKANEKACESTPISK